MAMEQNSKMIFKLKDGFLKEDERPGFNSKNITNSILCSDSIGQPEMIWRCM